MGLFTPAWKGYDSKKALAAIEKCSDQKKLAQIVREATFPDWRTAAARRMTDQQLLHDLASERSLGDIDLQRAIMERLNDQVLLADVARNARDDSIRRDAVEKLTDQNVLAAVAAKEENLFIFRTAVEKIHDPALRRSLALAGPNPELRRKALETLTDQEKLAGFARTDPDRDVRRAAVAKLTDGDVLAQIALTDPDWVVRRDAIERGLIGQTTLAEAARSDKLADVRRAAREQITDSSVQIELALGEKEDDGARVWAIRHMAENDPRLLTLALEEKNADVACAAIRRLRDPELLLRVASGASGSQLEEVLKGLSERGDLIRLAQTNDDPAVIARLRKLGFYDEAALTEIQSRAKRLNPTVSLELDKLRFLKENEKNQALVDAYKKRDVKALEELHTVQAVEAAILLLREYPTEETYGQTGPSSTAFSVAQFLRSAYNTHPELHPAIREANAHGVPYHLDRGGRSCHIDEGPIVFEFE